MSCPDEVEYLLYLDGELPLGEVRRLETHLVGCQTCRTLMVALRDETRSIADALHGRAPAARAASPAAAPARGLAFGFPVAIAGAAAALTVAGTLLESSLPGGLELFNPLRLKGAYEMAFDVVFALRTRAPGLLEFALSVAGVLSVSALASLAVGALVRRAAGGAALLLCLAALVAPGRGTALETRFDEDTHVRSGEVVTETLVASGDEVRVDGTVQGDLVAFAERVSVRGRVEGGLFVFARELEVTGAVQAGVVVVAERVRIEGAVSGNVYALAERFGVDASGRIGGDATLFGERADLEGAVARDVVFGGQHLEIGGSVGRHLDALHAHRLVLVAGARIGGDLDAMLPEDVEVELEEGAVVTGELRKRGHSHAEVFFARFRTPHFYLFLVVELAAAFAFGVLLYLLAPALFAASIPTSGAFLRALGWGLAALVATPVAILATALTVVGIPIAVLGLFGYLTALYLAEVAVGALIGRALLHPGPGVGAFARALLVGLAILAAGHAVPFLGPAVGAVSLLLGLGLLVDRARHLRPVRT